MKQTATTPVPLKLMICVLGMDTRARQTLGMAFNGPGKKKYMITENIEEAHATIIDMDSVGSLKLWKSCQQKSKGLPVIAISVNERNLNGVAWLKKPVRINVLFRMLDKIQEELKQQTSSIHSVETSREESTIVAFPDIKNNEPQEAETDLKHARDCDAALDMTDDTSLIYCGQAEDIDLADMEQRAKIHYAPELYFQGILKKATEVAAAKQKPIRIDGIQKPIIVLPDKRGLITDLDDKLLRALCYSPAIQSAILLEPVILDLDGIESHQGYQRIDQYMWKTILLSSRGRIPEGVDTWEPVHMRCWPNFTRMTITPHAMRIASLWAQEPHSLVATARMLGISQRYVFTFFSAAYAMGYVDIPHSTNSGQSVTEHKVRKLRSHKRRGLFERILQHLGAAK